MDDVDALLSAEIENAVLWPAIQKNRELANADALIQAILENRQVVDEACQYFAKARRWPQMDALLACACLNRVTAAREALRFLRGSDRETLLAPSPRCSKLRLLEFLLIDHWRAYGESEFRLHPIRK